MSDFYLSPLLFEKAVRAALEEDLGRAGDITTLACIPAGRKAVAVLAPRKPGVICGLAVAEAAFRIVDPSVTFEYLAADGDQITTPRTAVARISGDAR